MKDLCVVKLKNGECVVRKMDCDSDLRYLDLHGTTWWVYGSSKAFKDCCTTDSKKRILKRFDKIVNNLIEERNNLIEKRRVEVIKSFLCDSELKEVIEK